MNDLIPLFRVNDLEQTEAFYTQHLGFRLCRREGDTISLQRGKVGVMFSTGDNLGRAPSLSGTLYFYPQNVRRLWEQIHDKVDIEWPLQEMEYGTLEFGIRDCNGYILAFAEVQESAG